MAISGATYREGVAYSPDGAMYVASAPGSSGMPTLVAASFTTVSGAADANENILATVTIPAGALGTTGVARVKAAFSFTNSGNAKTMRIRYSGIGGTIYGTVALTNQLYTEMTVHIGNKGATNSQGGGYTELRNAALSQDYSITSAVDTTAATTVVITGQKAVAGETLTLVGYTAEILRT